MQHAYFISYTELFHIEIHRPWVSKSTLDSSQVASNRRASTQISTDKCPSNQARYVEGVLTREMTYIRYPKSAPQDCWMIPSRCTCKASTSDGFPCSH